MMHKQLKDIPVSERAKMVSLFPWGVPFFREWRLLRWFLASLLPVMASALSPWFREHRLGTSLFIGILGAYLAACLFVALCSGMTSSNWGTFFRQSEPTQYWSTVVIMGALYLGCSCAGYLV
jgi:lipopolysaccharide export LptBFGC system permease protein LptF